ncbi:MAG TPA: DUF6580 family putative transport protein [Candidatus Paceibacterota bacterium]
MRKNATLKIGIAILLVVFGVLSRWLPHLGNFTPVFAITLFSAVYLGRAYHIVVPISLMFMSDIGIGFYEWPIMISVYGSFILGGFLGELIKKSHLAVTVAASSFLGSLVFFLATNFAVWKWSPMYEQTFRGLMQSYEMGLPFFRNTLLGDLFYVALLFGAYELVLYVVRKRREALSFAKS